MDYTPPPAIVVQTQGDPADTSIDALIDTSIDTSIDERKIVPLGVLNGRVYTFAVVNGRSVIMIQNVVPDRIGKFELADTPDYLDSGGEDDGKR